MGTGITSVKTHHSEKATTNITGFYQQRAALQYTTSKTRYEIPLDSKHETEYGIGPY